MSAGTAIVVVAAAGGAWWLWRQESERRAAEEAERARLAWELAEAQRQADAGASRAGGNRWAPLIGLGLDLADRAGWFAGLDGWLSGSQHYGTTPGRVTRTSSAPPSGRQVAGAVVGGLIGAPDSLIRTESGGRWDARNDVPGAGGVGHFGRVQFSRARIADAIAAGALPKGTTPEDFMASPALQQSAERWHFADLNRRIDQWGLTDAIGTTINGVPVTRDGLVAVGHLGGAGGMRRWVQTAGRYNPSDDFGTSLTDYARIHG